jgi:hypothetical protein
MAYEVSGAGSTEYNDVYTHGGTFNGQPYYESASGLYLYWGSSHWDAWILYDYLVDFADLGPYEAAYTTYPYYDIEGTWDVGNGDSPPPSVTECTGELEVNLSYNADINIGTHSVFYIATYYTDCYIHGKTACYEVEVTILNAFDFSYSADVGVTEYVPDGLTGESYSEVIQVMNNKLEPQTILYPKNGYYITKSGKNEFFGESKTISSQNEIIYIDYQTTNIEVNNFLYYALLQLNIVRVNGTSNNIILNIYVAEGNVDEYTGWSAVKSSGVLRGDLLTSKEVNLSDDNEIIYIDVYDFMQNYMWITGETGIIIEMVPGDGTANVKIVGLYCWDNDAGEKQNPIIKLYYGQTSNSYIGANRILQAVSEDTYIDSYNMNTNYEDANLIRIDKNGSQEEIGLFKFDFSVIPPGSDIKKAMLYLPKDNTSPTQGQRVLLYRILQDWDENTATWLSAEDDTNWRFPGCYYDDSDHYTSYNMIVGEESNKYDITKLMQIIIGSFGHSVSIGDFGFMLKGEDLVISSKDVEDVAYIDVIYMAKNMNQPPERPILETPADEALITTQPTFIAIIKKDNAYGDTEGDDLHFRLEVSTDKSFSDSNITSFSTSDSITGWSWSALGDFSDASTTFPIPAGSYTPGTSKIKFDMSGTSATLTEGNVWSWRMFAIDE